MEKQNRAERRRSKFGGGRATEHGGWPTHEPNPIFRGEPTAAEQGPGADDQRKANKAPTRPAAPAEGSQAEDRAES